MRMLIRVSASRLSITDVSKSICPVVAICMNDALSNGGRLLSDC